MWVSFVEYRLFPRALLHKRPMFLRCLLICKSVRKRALIKYAASSTSQWLHAQVSQKCPIYPQKSPVSPQYPQQSRQVACTSSEMKWLLIQVSQKSPIYMQISPMSPQKCPTYQYQQTCFLYLQKSPDFFVCLVSFPWHIHRRAVLRASQYAQKSPTHLQTSPNFLVCRVSFSWHVRRRAVLRASQCAQKSPTHL